MLQLVAIERGAPAIAFHHHQLAQLHALEGGEAAAAIGTDAPAPDRGSVLGRARILDLRIEAAAIGASHKWDPRSVSSARTTGRRSSSIAESHSTRRADGDKPGRGAERQQAAGRP